jgi:hypothetical protein
VILNRFAVIVVAGVALAGCAVGPQQQAAGPAGCKPLGGGGGNSDTTNAVIGGVAGGVLGGVIGSSVSKNSRVGARNGILLGALTGALVGSQYNKMIGMTEQDDGSVKLNIPGSVMFRSGSAEISPAFAGTLDSVANTIKEYCGVTGTVIGHTDSTGDTRRQPQIVPGTCPLGVELPHGSRRRRRAPAAVRAWPGRTDCPQQHRSRSCAKPSRGDFRPATRVLSTAAGGALKTALALVAGPFPQFGRPPARGGLRALPTLPSSGKVAFTPAGARPGAVTARQ